LEQHPPADLLAQEAPCLQAPNAEFVRCIHDDHREARAEEVERHGELDHDVSLPRGGYQLRKPRPNGGVHNGLEFPQLSVIGEDDPAQRSPIDASLDDYARPLPCHLGERPTSGLVGLVGHPVGVNDS
jgi:hypothetical protein